MSRSAESNYACDASPCLKGVTEFEKYSLTYAWDLQDFSIFFPFPEETAYPNRYSRVSSPLFTVAKGSKFESRWHLTASLNLLQGRRCFGLHLELHDEVTAETKVVACSLKVVTPEGRDLEKAYFTDVYDSRQELLSFGWPNFKDLDMILEEEEVYLTDGTLRVILDMTLMGDLLTANKSQIELTAQSRIIKLTERNSDRHETIMLQLFNSGLLADAVIVSGQISFPVHVSILAAHSQVFQRIFDTQMKEGISRILDLSNYDHEVLRILLQYLYTGDTSALLLALYNDAEVNLCTQLITLADMYLLQGLKEACFMYLVLNIKPENAGVIALLVYYHSHDEKMKHDVGIYCIENWAILSKNQSFLKCYTKSPDAIDEMCREREVTYSSFCIQPTALMEHSRLVQSNMDSTPESFKLPTIFKMAIGAYFVGLAAFGINSCMKR